MPSAISKRELQLLRECIWYLNLAEMREFCRAHDLPLYVHVEGSKGGLRRTADRDRKDIVLERIMQFALHGKKSGPTTYASNVVADGPLPERLTARTRLHYGQYEKKNENFVQTLKRLTDGAFENGMIARLVLRDFWIAGTVPTFRQFAEEWTRAKAAHVEPRPEGAYLFDLSKGRVGEDWKEVRIQKAGQALRILAKLTT